MRKRKNLEGLADDIRDHIRRETEENIERGMSPGEARYAALNKFGNVTLAMEDTRAVWLPVWLEQLWQDARYGGRMLRRNPGFAATVVLTLALGIGMNTAVFSVLNAVLLRPLAAPSSDRLLWMTLYDRQWQEEWVSDWDFLDWKEQAHSFDRIAGYEISEMRIPQDGAGAKAQIAAVSDDFWEVAGIHSEIGRLPGPGEGDAVVLTHGFFERYFRGNAGILERPIKMAGSSRLFTVVGVLPANFRFEFPAGFAPFDFHDVDAYAVRNPARGTRGTVSVVGQIKQGVPLERAREELAAIHSRSHGNPRDTSEMELRVMPLLEKRVGEARQALWILQVAVLFVLLIACANIANLLLARASVRQREIAIRASVGAGRARVLRQFMVENVLLAVLGGAAGLLVAQWAISVMLRLIPHAVPRLAETTVDGPVLLFAAGVSTLTALVFGPAPAVALCKVDLHDALKDGARTASAAPLSMRARKLLVAAELAFAVVLLSGAGLLLKSYWRMNAHPAGFEPDRILIVKTSAPMLRLSPASGVTFVSDALRRLGALPGVEAATVTTGGPNEVMWVGLPPPRGVEEPPLTLSNMTSSAYPRVMGLRMLRGRWFHDGERAIVVNESLVRRDFGGREPIGQRTEFGATVVGVVADLKHSKLDRAPEPEFYASYSTSYAGPPRSFEAPILVKAAADPAALAPAIREAMADVDKTRLIISITTMEEVLSDSIAPRRFNLFLMGTFAATALVLALIGIYGVIAYSVAQRTQEIGIRMTLGAERAQVVRMVVRQGISMAVSGIVIGVVAALAASRVIAGLLYDVSPTDPAALMLAVSLMGVAATAACWIPARRAARGDPIVALRTE